MGQLACHTIVALFYSQVYAPVRIAAKSHYSSARVCRDTPTPLDCNAGGTVYEGQDTYPSVEAALQDLEAGIKAYFDENGI
jgi:hypothetical protein